MEGHSIGDFAVIREIGRGGMGIVFEAQQISLGRRVALKILLPPAALEPRIVERFHREAAMVAKLRHPGIVDVYSVGEDQGYHFFAMELIEGRSLSAMIADGVEPAEEVHVHSMFGVRPPGPPPQTRRSHAQVQESCRLISRLAAALEHAHKSGVVHRDVKPANVLVRGDGTPVLTDFGIARDCDETSGLTRSGDFVGTVHYVSPEQAMSQRVEVDHRTDIYSLGVSLFEALTLRRPFDGDSSNEILGKIITKEPPDPRRFNRSLPRELATIVLKAMEKDPDRRYQTAAELAADLDRFLERRPILAVPPSHWRRTWKFVRRHPAAFGGVLVFAGGVALGGALF